MLVWLVGIRYENEKPEQRKISLNLPCTYQQRGEPASNGQFEDLSCRKPILLTFPWKSRCKSNSVSVSIMDLKVQSRRRKTLGLIIATLRFPSRVILTHVNRFAKISWKHAPYKMASCMSCYSVLEEELPRS